jgi:hypothetical protein
MMEGTANYVARVAVGEPPARTAERLRAARRADDIRWRFYDTGAALCLLLDRLSPGWQERSEQQPALTIFDMMDTALRTHHAEAATFSGTDTAGFGSRAAADIADLSGRQQRLRSEILERRGPRVVVEVEEGAEPFRVQRFDPINLMVLDAGEIAHANFLSLSVPQGTVELTNPGFVRNSFGGTIGLTAPAGRHPLSDGIRHVAIAGINGVPKVGRDAESVTVEASGVRLALRGAEVRVDGEVIRLILKGTKR